MSVRMPAVDARSAFSSSLRRSRPVEPVALVFEPATTLVVAAPRSLALMRRIAYRRPPPRGRLQRLALGLHLMQLRAHRFLCATCAAPCRRELLVSACACGPSIALHRNAAVPLRKELASSRPVVIAASASRRPTAACAAATAASSVDIAVASCACAAAFSSCAVLRAKWSMRKSGQIRRVAHLYRLQRLRKACTVGLVGGVHVAHISCLRRNTSHPFACQGGKGIG